MKTTPKIGPRMPGGAFTKARTTETKLGTCTVKRKTRVFTRTKGNAILRRQIDIDIDCGEGRTGGINARHYPSRDEDYSRAYGLRTPRPLWFVGEVDTEERAQRQGIATRAYEALAKYVCRQGGLLVSNARLADAYSNDFWQKQLRKGRARVVEKHGDAFVHATVLLDCRHAGDLSGGLGQLTTRTSRVVLAAKAAGYRVDAKGRVIAPSGRVRKTQTKGSAHGPYRYRTFSMKDGEHVVAVPVAHLAAAQKYGKKALRAGVEVRHLNDRSTDDRLANIAIGSRHTNIMDSPKAKRVRIAKAGARAAKRARRKR